MGWLTREENEHRAQWWKGAPSWDRHDDRLKFNSMTQKIRKEGGERQGTAQLMAAGVKMQQEGLRVGGGSSESNNGPLLFDN